MTNNIADDWLLSYRRHVDLTDTPNYFANRPQDLISQATPIRYSLGNGHQIFTSSIIPACLETEHELILVTCFWAKSSTRDAIADLLRRLSEKALARSDGRRIQVRMCFSSTSIFQKLFQTSLLDGKIYPSTEWVNLGLPAPEELRGVDLLVKSIFVLPFSVMHPKFVVVDRQHAFIPSCNVSWESWFEGCIEMQGETCTKLMDFYMDFWTRGTPRLDDSWVKTAVARKQHVREATVTDPDLINHHDFERANPLQTILLPSPHHINPNFSPFSNSVAPSTPLNTFILQAVNRARSTIHIQTPNLTSRPLIRALTAALTRGVNITITTSSLLMIPEQIVTAFTTTEIEVWKLRRAYNQIVTTYRSSSQHDTEAQIPKPGNLMVRSYTPRSYGDAVKEPVKSHLKLTIVDEEITVLGSGNMDRASWFTSQELGVAICDAEFARAVKECTEEALVDRTRLVLNS